MPSLPTNETLKNSWEKIIMLLMPIVPHLAHELCQKINKKSYWPQYNLKLLEEESCKIIVQIDGKKRALIDMAINTEEKMVIKKAVELESVSKYLKKAEVKKNIYIKNKLLNFITKK